MSDDTGGSKVLEAVEAVRAKARGLMEATADRKALDDVRVALLGRKGELTAILKGMKDLAESERRKVGEAANALKGWIEEAIGSRLAELSRSEAEGAAGAPSGGPAPFDVTLPGTGRPAGSIHPVTAMRRKVEGIFAGMGFMVVDGPELESEFHNFVALNIPETHPARDMQDTFWCDDGQCLRTHTSPVQVRALIRYGAPIRMIAPGRCFRNESIDASHENTFFQVEGMMVDSEVSVANLIHVMKAMLSEVFGMDVDVRLRPGYFPFVEPGFELDMRCSICGGQGCPTCKRSGWVELVPCGMVHPNVLRHSGVDPDRFSGFAFGLGLTRLAMMSYRIGDIRVFNSGDLRALAGLGSASPQAV
ncbi:MAG: phenylalanine--tRNA ligase subunit alpha [Oscillospiraceae bacterium]|nr:phenylalanine--tRNA ligase subunit alpha [Oscillospiraceae bacterium]